VSNLTALLVSLVGAVVLAVVTWSAMAPSASSQGRSRSTFIRSNSRLLRLHCGDCP
jgi:hypothetical protein